MNSCEKNNAPKADFECESADVFADAIFHECLETRFRRRDEGVFDIAGWLVEAILEERYKRPLKFSM